MSLEVSGCSMLSVAALASGSTLSSAMTVSLASVTLLVVALVFQPTFVQELEGRAHSHSPRERLDQ